MKALTKEVYFLSWSSSLSSTQLSHPRLLYCLTCTKVSLITYWLILFCIPLLLPHQVRLETNIFHPNINIDGKVCLKLLDPRSWIPSTKIIQSKSIKCTPAVCLDRTIKLFFFILLTYIVLEAISGLLEQPDSDDPYVPEIASLHKNNLKEFNRLAVKYTKRYAIEDSKKVIKPMAKKSKPKP